MQLFGDKGELELGRQVARDAVFMAEAGPEIVESVDEVGPQLEVNIPIQRRAVQGPTSESKFLVIERNVVAPKTDVQVAEKIHCGQLTIQFRIITGKMEGSGNGLCVEGRVRRRRRIDGSWRWRGRGVNRSHCDKRGRTWRAEESVSERVGRPNGTA